MAKVVGKLNLRVVYENGNEEEIKRVLDNAAEYLAAHGLLTDHNQELVVDGWQSKVETRMA